MNKQELAEELGLSLVTVSRYINMGLPYERVKGKYHFDIDEVQDWIDDNIDQRPQELNEYRPSVKEIATFSLNMAQDLLGFIRVKACPGCREKYMRHIESGGFKKNDAMS